MAASGWGIFQVDLITYLGCFQFAGTGRPDWCTGEYNSVLIKICPVKLVNVKILFWKIFRERDILYSKPPDPPASSDKWKAAVDKK